MPSSLRTALALLAAAALLLAPALWNGAPIAFFDSGDYIQAAFSLAPDYYRTLPYSLWLALAGGRWSLWLPLTAQALVTAWVLLQAVWAFAPARPAAHLAILAALLVLGSGLPWFTGQIMPDAFTGLIPLALAVLAYGDEGDAAAGASFGPGRGARLLLAVLLAVAVGVHGSHTPLALGFAALLLLLAGAARLRPALPRPRLGLALLGLAAGIAITPLAHKAATGEAFLNRAGNVFLLGRWVQDGLAAAHLRRACPEAGYKLCPHAETLPATANDLLWDRRSPLWQLGGWEAFDEEAARIVRRSLMEDPIGNLAAAGRNWLIQLPMFETGDGLVPQVETTQRVIGERYPAEAAAYDSARQQRKPGLDFEPLNLYQVPLGWLALAANAAAALGLWRTAPRLRGLALLALAGVLGNAAVCAILSNPDDRYQNRMVWVALAAAALIAMARTRRAG